MLIHKQNDYVEDWMLDLCADAQTQYNNARNADSCSAI